MNFWRRLFYLLWYFRKPPWDTNITPPEVSAFIQSHPAGRALDLGCGTGTNAITLAKAGWQVQGVDFIGKAIRAAHKKAHRAGVQVDFQVGDVTDLRNVHGEFDFILDIGCFHSLSAAGQQRYLTNLERLLATGGSFLLYAFFRADPAARGAGTTEEELAALARRFSLVSRQDGSEGGWRRSAWLEFRNDTRSKAGE
jgi:cyclopropane fatty-acyl-phospholipid synthase-like methyltransferase